MGQIFFSKDIPSLLKSAFDSDFGNNSLVTYHAMYDKPDVGAGHVIEWEKYKAIHSNFEPDKIILIGVNRMITPSNRCDFIHAYLAVMTPQISKIIIDTAPFIGEPWRLYYHYQIANCFKKFGANYSYPIERDWLRWFHRETDDCQFSPKNLKDCVVNTYSDLDRLETEFDFYVPEKDDLEWYEEVRRFEFEKFRTPKLLLNNLMRSANNHFDIKVTFDSYLKGGVIKIPDVSIYRFMVEENCRRRDIYNLFTKAA